MEPMASDAWLSAEIRSDAWWAVWPTRFMVVTAESTVALPWTALCRISAALEAAPDAVARIWPIDATSSSLADANAWVDESISREADSSRAAEIAVSLPWMLRSTVRSRRADVFSSIRAASATQARDSASSPSGTALRRSPCARACMNAINRSSRR